MEAPRPPFFWIEERLIAEWVEPCELGRIAGRHVGVWLEWVNARTAREEPTEELVRRWKRKRLRVPGARHFRDINPKEDFEFNSDSDEDEETKRNVEYSCGKCLSPRRLPVMMEYSIAHTLGQRRHHLKRRPSKTRREENRQRGEIFWFPVSQLHPVSLDCALK